jgi:hypothetical protein
VSWRKTLLYKQNPRTLDPWKVFEDQEPALLVLALVELAGLNFAAMGGGSLELESLHLLMPDRVEKMAVAKDEKRKSMQSKFM